MALTRKMLSAMGIEDDKIDQIIEAHTDTVNGLKEEIDKYKADANRLPNVEKELEEARSAMSNGEKSPYKVKYEAIVEERNQIQKDFDDFKASVAAKEALSKKQTAYRQLLKDVGVSEKRIDAIMRVSNFDSLEFDKDDHLKNTDELKENIKSEWSDFIVTEGVQGTHVANPPMNTGGSKVLSREEIMKIKDTAERQNAWAIYLENERKK